MHFWSRTSASTGAAKFRNAFVLAQQVFVHSGAGLVALGIPFRQQLFVFRGALAGGGFFFLDLRHLGFQFELGGFHVLVAGVGVEHQFQNLVFVGLDFLLGELDFVQQRFVLFVGFYGERLVAILGDFALQVLDGAFVLSPGGFVGLDGGFGLFQSGFGAGQLFFDGGHAFGQRGDFLIEAENFAVRLL